MIHGSCLCRGIRFQFSKPVTPIWMCHCSLCRKSTGSASNAALLVPKDDLEWLGSQELLQVNALPNGRRAAFCRTCGSPMPLLHPGGGAWWVPAGVLDDDPGVRVASHIFVGSKAPWDEIGGDALQFEEGLGAPGSR